MPYIEALVLESLRLFMSFACALPHRATKDTKLNGYDIPKVCGFTTEFLYVYKLPNIIYFYYFRIQW